MTCLVGRFTSVLSISHAAAGIFSAIYTVFSAVSRHIILFFVRVDCTIIAFSSLFSRFVLAIIRTFFSFLFFVEGFFERVGEKRSFLDGTIFILFLEKTFVLGNLVPTRVVMTVLLILMIRFIVEKLSAEFSGRISVDIQSCGYIAIVYFSDISVIQPRNLFIGGRYSCNFAFGVVEGVKGAIFVYFFRGLWGHSYEQIVSDALRVNFFEVVADDIPICGFNTAVGTFLWAVEVFQLAERGNFHLMEFSYKKHLHTQSTDICYSNGI